MTEGEEEPLGQSCTEVFVDAAAATRAAIVEGTVREDGCTVKHSCCTAGLSANSSPRSSSSRISSHEHLSTGGSLMERMSRALHDGHASVDPIRQCDIQQSNLYMHTIDMRIDMHV